MAFAICLSDKSGMSGNDLKERVADRLKALGITAFEAARRADVARTYVDDLLRDKKKGFQASKLEAVARALETTSEWLMNGGSQVAPPPKEVPDQATDRLRPSSFVPDGFIGKRDLIGAADFPVYAAAMGGSGHLIVTFDPIDWVRRPQPLEHIREGYGILVTGESMIPAFRPSEIALVHPKLPYERDTDVVLYHTTQVAEAECMIKHLVTFNDREWTLEQYRPELQFNEFRKEWPVCHRVVGKYNRR